MDGGYGTWKYYKKGRWELYDMENDRAESRNLSGEYPELVKEMSQMWEDWTKKVPVYPIPWEEYKNPVRDDYVAPKY